jgi:hypothetical protein
MKYDLSARTYCTDSSSKTSLEGRYRTQGKDREWKWKQLLSRSHLLNFLSVLYKRLREKTFYEARHSYNACLLLWANICLRLSSNAHIPLTTGFELRITAPPAGGPKKGRIQPIFGQKGYWGGGGFIGHFSCYRAFFVRCRRFFWLLATGHILGALVRSIAPTAAFSPQKKRKKPNGSKKRFQCTQSRTSTETRTLPTRYSTYSAQCKFGIFTRQDLFNRPIFMD